MPWKCPQCGVMGADDRRVCEACSFVEFGSLTLVSAVTGKELKVNLDTTVGRSLLRSLGDEDAKYASDPQFMLKKDAALGAWSVNQALVARNPTFYNGTQVPDDAPVKLEQGGVLSIGPEKMKLTVQLVFAAG